MMRVWRVGISAMLTALYSGAMGALAAPTGEEPPNAHLDRELYPKAYGILSSDHLMFPVDVSDWPLRIDSRRQLFVDDYLIASLKDLKREWHQPVKYPGNPLMSGELPWEGDCLIPLFIQRDADSGRFRMWYSSWLRYQGPEGVGMRFPTLYAESDDGVTWRRPELGILSYAGSTKNNFVIHGGSIHGLLEATAPARPEQRFTALVLLEPDYVEREGYYIYTSADGIHWSSDRTRCVIPSLRSYTMPQGGLGDTTIFRHDPVLGLTVCDAKFVLPGKMRSRGQCESEDLIHWSRPRFTLYPDEHDEPDSEIYGNLSFVYESMWLGLCRVMHSERTGWKQVEVELSLSRDGYHWARPAERKPFLPLGDADSWEPDYTDGVSNGPLLIGDELWFYYRGSRSPDRTQKAKRAWEMAIGLAKLRRDGFASLDAGDSPGSLVTRPLTFSGRSLFVNVAVDKSGWVKAAVLTGAGEAIARYGLENSIPVARDTTAARMTWSGVERLPLPEDEHLRLQFQLKHAQLYSFWIE